MIYAIDEKTICRTIKIQKKFEYLKPLDVIEYILAPWISWLDKKVFTKNEFKI